MYVYVCRDKYIYILYTNSILDKIAERKEGIAISVKLQNFIANDYP